MRTVVFDLDGTLADTAADLVAAANACLRGLGLGDRLDPATDQLTAFGGGKAMLRLGFDRAGRRWTEADIDAQYLVLLAAYADAIAVHTRMYPGAVAAVETLRAAGFRTAICTNKPEGLAVDLCARLGIAPLFDALIGADTLATRKPDPAPYREAVERAGGAVTRSLLIGDTETDAKTARAAGVPLVLVGFGPEGGGLSRLDPDAMLERFEDLPTLVERFLGGA